MKGPADTSHTRPLHQVPKVKFAVHFAAHISYCVLLSYTLLFYNPTDQAPNTKTAFVYRYFPLPIITADADRD